MKTVFFLFSILFVLNVSSQEVTTDNDTVQLPTSIYTTSLTKLISVNNQFKMVENEDLLLRVESIKNQISSIFTERLGKQSFKFFNERFQEKSINKFITSTFFDVDALYNLPRENPKKIIR